MTQPIGAGFSTADISSRVSSTKVVTHKPLGLLEQPAAQKTNANYVKNTKEGAALANELFNSSTKSNAYRQTIYDQPTAQVSKAISTYTEFANLDRRAEVQALIGVNIFA